MVKKYGIVELIDSGYDIAWLQRESAFVNKTEYDGDLARLQQLAEILDKEDLYNILGNPVWTSIIDIYGIDKLLSYGFKNLQEICNEQNNLYKIKEKLDKRIPKDLIYIGKYSDEKWKFIEKYGIDNLIKLDEETNGIFSHEIWGGADIFLSLFALNDPKVITEDKKNVQFKEFRDIAYKILYWSREYDVQIKNGDWPDYDFIGGEFRKEHQEIFLDEEIDEELRQKFYRGTMHFEDVRLHPELIQILKGKDLKTIFRESIGLSEENSSRYPNMAQYISEKIGQEEFLKLCADYGKLLDSTTISEDIEITLENVRDIIEENIYKKITERGMEYFEYLPDSFKEKHPELFLPSEIPEYVRESFYKGELAYEDIKKNPQLKDILRTKNLDVGFSKKKYEPYGLGDGFWKGPNPQLQPLWKYATEDEILNYAEKYGNWLKDVDQNIFKEGQLSEEREKLIEKNIEENILNRKSPFTWKVPEFFKEKYPEMFLENDAPDSLKREFNDMYKSEDLWQSHLDLFDLPNHPDWISALRGKNFRRALMREYDPLFDFFDCETVLNIIERNPNVLQTIETMLRMGKVEEMARWYNQAGFLPHPIVMLNFPIDEIDTFLANAKKWSQLMRIERYNLNDDVKAAILKAAYTMGMFTGDDKCYTDIVNLFTGVPHELTIDEYDEIFGIIERDTEEFIDEHENDEEGWAEITPIDEEDIQWEGDDWEEDTQKEDPEKQEALEFLRLHYKKQNNDKYVLKIEEKEEYVGETKKRTKEEQKKEAKRRDREIKEKTKEIREALEKVGLSKILTLQKAHQLFGAFEMKFDSEFAKFLLENIEEILADSEHISMIPQIQRRFEEIRTENAGIRKITLSVAENFIKDNKYKNIDIGNEELAILAGRRGYSQRDFERLQQIYNEGELRDFSSIPRVIGETKEKYTYEMLRLDDPLALVIGPLTDCCQRLDGEGQTSMEHSVVSQDGRLFVVRNERGEIVAQSWFWRNQNVGCFDNIEIPDKIFERYRRENPLGGKRQLTKEILEAYKKAALELMESDKQNYNELLQNGDITQEQYDALVFGKITVGAGYNDIQASIKLDKDLERDDINNLTLPKKTRRLPYIYDDSHYADDGTHEGQWIITKREGAIYNSNEEARYLNQDDIAIYDKTNVNNTLLRMLKRMEEASGRDNLLYVDGKDSETIMQNISKEYGTDKEKTLIIATHRIAMIYTKINNIIKIGDLFRAPIKEDLSDEQKEVAQKHITYQIKKALKQIGVAESFIDMSGLSEEDQQILQSIIDEIKQEKDERGEK